MMTSRSTDNQMAALASALLRTDRALAPPRMLKGGALAKITKGLIDRKFAREMRAKGDVPIWRRDDEKRAYGLAITAAGRKMLRAGAAAAKSAKTPESLPIDDNPGRPPAEMALDVPGAHEDHQAISPSAATEAEASMASIPSDPQPATEATPQATVRKAPEKEPRAGTKQALVIEMLNRPNGAGILELIVATDWLAHTTRAMITGLRKRGYQVERVKDGDQTSRHRILGRTEAPAENVEAPPKEESVVEGV